MPVCPQQWLSLAPGAAGSRPSVVPRLPSRQPTLASVAHGGRTLLVGRLPPPPALGGTWTEQVQSRTERRTNLHNRRRKKQATPGSGRVPASLRSRGGYVFGGARCRRPGGGSVELGVHDARVPSRGRTQPARGHRIQAAALGEVPWFPVHPVATPWTGRAGPHAGEANSDLAPGRGGSGGWASGKFKGPVGRG